MGTSVITKPERDYLVGGRQLGIHVLAEGLFEGLPTAGREALRRDREQHPRRLDANQPDRIPQERRPYAQALVSP